MEGVQISEHAAEVHDVHEASTGFGEEALALHSKCVL